MRVCCRRLNAQSLTDRLTARLSGSDDAAFAVDMMNGRTLEFTVQPMENGGMVVLVEDVTERRIAEAKINHLARFDALTGLPNRNVLRDRMEKALAEWRPDNMCAIHFIDLDQFKQVNDTLGHTRGDMLLQAVAHRLREHVGDADVISRFGGDEFVILQAPVKSIEQSEALATRVLNAVAGTYDLDGHKVVVTASIGIALAKTQSIRTNFCAMPTLRFIRPSPTVAAPGAGSKQKWRLTPRRGELSNLICAVRPRARISNSTISQSST